MNGGDKRKYFYMFRANRHGCAASPRDIPIWPVGDLPFEQVILQWKPFELTLKRMLKKKKNKDGVPADYVSSNLSLRICSSRLRAIVDALKNESDEVEWYPVYIKDEHGHRHEYFVLYLPKIAEVVDPQKTTYSADGSPIRWCLSRGKVGERRVFRLSKYGISLVVSEEMKQAIVAAGCTGMTFGRVPTSP